MLERLRRDVSTLAQSDGREPGTQPHANARRYLVERLAELGAVPYSDGAFELAYLAEGQEFVNVAALIPGRSPELPAILLDAHYDTCGPQPGADDNAAAIAILLAAIESIRARGLDRSVILLFPDAEEPPHFLTDTMGSTVFHHTQRQHEIHCAVVLDLVGHDVPLPGLADLLFITGLESDPGLATVLETCSEPRGIRPVPTLTRYIGDLGDYHVHRVTKRPYLFLSCAHWQHYHAPTDTPEKLNYAKMAGIVDYLVDLTATLDTQALHGPFEGYDSTPTELRFMRKALGSVVGSLGLSLDSRRDIDLVAAVMTQHFGL